MRAVRVTAPAEPVVTLLEAKAQCRVDFDDDDTLIEALVAAATRYLDGFDGILGRCLVSQTWAVTYDAWSWDLDLPFPDVSAVALTYRDEAGDEQTVAADDFAIVRGSTLRLLSAFTHPGLHDAPEAITATVTAGYGGAEDVPASLKAAILLHVGHLYENREAVRVGDGVAELPLAYHALIAPYRVWP